MQDEAGQPYALPFLGGLDVPRPQFVDIDGDGDHDLFVQEYSNAVWFFENTGSAYVQLFWQSSQIAKTLVPAEALFAPGT